MHHDEEMPDDSFVLARYPIDLSLPARSPESWTMPEKPFVGDFETR